MTKMNISNENKIKKCAFDRKYGKYQPRGEGGTQSPPAKSKMAVGGPKMADGGWKGIYH